jgi:hypothetical protein
MPGGDNIHPSETVDLWDDTAGYGKPVWAERAGPLGMVPCPTPMNPTDDIASPLFLIHSWDDIMVHGEFFGL